MDDSVLDAFEAQWVPPFDISDGDPDLQTWRRARRMVDAGAYHVLAKEADLESPHTWVTMIDYWLALRAFVAGSTHRPDYRIRYEIYFMTRYSINAATVLDTYETYPANVVPEKLTRTYCCDNGSLQMLSSLCGDRDVRPRVIHAFEILVD